MKLTGNTRYRSNWRGKLILQVEDRGIKYENCGAYVDSMRVRYWRDATVEDLSGLCSLVPLFDATLTAKEAKDE